MRDAGVALLARPRMHGDRRQTITLGDAPHLAVNQLAIRPAGAELAGQRNLNGRPHGRQNLPHQRQITQQAAATVAANHFLHRAAKVDIDRVKALRLANPRRLGHDLRVRPKQLRRDRMLVRLKGQVPRTLVHLDRAHRLHDAVRRGELRHQQSAMALFADQPPKDGVRHPRHWRQNGGRGNRNRRRAAGRTRARYQVAFREVNHLAHSMVA